MPFILFGILSLWVACPFGNLHVVYLQALATAAPGGEGGFILQTCAPDLEEAASLLWPFIIYKALQVYMAFYETQRQGPCPVH